MVLLITVILFICLLSCLYYYQLNLYLAVGLLTLYLLLMARLDLWSYWLLLPFIVITLPLLLIPWRRKLFSVHVMKWLQQHQPVISHTEQSAIDAGTLWWEKTLFTGRPDWQQLHAFPAPTLTAEEQAFLQGPVEQLCLMINDFAISHTQADLPDEMWQFLRQERFFAMNIPHRYGGLAFSPYAQAQVLQKISGLSIIVGCTVSVPNSLGPAELLLQYGTTEQKAHYLPRLASGQEIPCFALTSPEAGSDASAIPDHGTLCKALWQGEEQLGIRITWNKRYITLAPVATLIGLAFKLYDPDHLIGEQEDLGITCALIPADHPGVEIGNRHFPLNVPFMNGPIRGNNIFIPLDFIIGGRKMAGQGWRMLMECLASARGISLPSVTSGSLKSITLGISAYARIRRQFKQPIGMMEGLAAPLANISGNAYMLDAAATLLTTALSQGEKPATLCSIVKYHATQRSRQAVINAMDIASGKGICLGPSNFIARAYQGAPITITVEGANILIRSLIVFGQGVVRYHPYLVQEMAACQQGDLKRFDTLLFSHIGYVGRNKVRSFWLGLTRGYGSRAPVNDATRRYYQHINRLSANLAYITDVLLLLLGKRLKQKERLSARLGDVWSQLYLSAATLKRFDEEGRERDDLRLLHWSIQDSLYQAQQALDDLLHNLPGRLLGWMLRLVIFPLGRPLAPPTDKLEKQLARSLLAPSPTRERLARGLFMQPTANNPVGQLQQALADIIAAEEVHQKLSLAVGKRLPFIYLDQLAQQHAQHLTEQEVAILYRAEQSRLRSISVDEFPLNALKSILAQAE